GAGRGRSGTSEHGDQSKEIGVRPETAALLESGAAQRERVGDECLADFGKRERVNGDVVALGIAAEVVQLVLAAVIGRLTDEEKDAIASRRALAEESDGAHSGVD